MHSCSFQLAGLARGFALIFLVGCGAGATQAWAAASESARTLYQQHCAACHGEHGDGESRAQRGLDPPPRDFTSAESREVLTRERMVTSVTYGRPGTAMVAWEGRLGSDQIAAIVDYIRENFLRTPSPGAPDSVGRSLYKQHCSACHGDRGSGAEWTRYSLNPAPRDFTATAAKTELDRRRMLLSVTNGRPRTAMMSFARRLSAAEIEAVVDYIRRDFMGVVTPAPETGPTTAAKVEAEMAAVDMGRPFPGGLRGDSVKGEGFYQANCYVCHGRLGDGEGPRAAFNRPPPRNFLAPEARRSLNRPALFNAIANGKRGTVMPAWKTVLDMQQIADVGEYVFSRFITAGSGTADADKKKVQQH